MRFSLIAVLIGLAAIAIHRTFPQPEDFYRRFPLSGVTYLPKADKMVGIPYHNYDSEVVIVHGWANPDGVRSKITNSAFHPVIDSTTGKALASFWVVDYKNTSVDPYKELVVVYTVALKPTTVNCHSIHCINVINQQPGIFQYIDKLLSLIHISEPTRPY
eukprot:TRINITY_DN20024_c0_g1_i1.p1 TRINITY_DN20024_c0_g1~~TRINITY_DN20024_c0_g1_i1.p1  ORF type:complete len:160 (+),score=43.74 TRINITY_DN20024_c0_g1_i1:187-666(+)